MPEPRIISYTCNDPSERSTLQHLAMMTVDRSTKNGDPTADVVMPFYGVTTEAAVSAAETWLADERATAAQKAASLEAAIAKRADLRKSKVAA